MNKQVSKLLKKKQPEQRTQEWFDARKTRITASEAACCLVKDGPTCDSYIDKYSLHRKFNKDGKCCNPYSSIKEFYNKKCGKNPPVFKGNISTYWGQKYEPIATMFYETLNNTDVIEFGLITHDTIPFLAASPDGITPSGTMLEIKCPFKRKITGIPPFYYWVQCQIQLNCCNLEQCDFLECNYEQYSTEDDFLNDHDTYPQRGVFIEVANKDDIYNQSTIKYVYCPKELVDKQDIVMWANNWLQYNTTSTDKVYKKVYYHLLNYSCIAIKRDDAWFNNVYPTLEKTHKQMLEYSNNPDLLEENVITIDTNPVLSFDNTQDTNPLGAFAIKDLF